MGLTRLSHGDYPLTPTPLLLYAFKYLFTDTQQIIKCSENKSGNTLTPQQDQCYLHCPWQIFFPTVLTNPQWWRHYILHRYLFFTLLTVITVTCCYYPNLCPCNSNKLPLVQLMKDFAFTGQEGVSPFTIGMHRFTFHFSEARESLQPETSIDFS